jgi:hypothetical protein
MENSSTTSSIIEEREKIIRAVSWKGNLEDPEFGDTTYRAFAGVMEQRREIARRCLSEQDENSRAIMYEMFKHCNDKIKLILGL